MPDQASNLRQLIHKVGPSSLDARDCGTPMIGVTGCRAGVGTTTIAVNLAAALADRGKRVLLVDAAEERPQVAELAGVRSNIELSLSDVLAGKGTAAEAIVPGPAGMMVLAQRGSLSSKRGVEFSPRRIFDRRNSATGASSDFSRQAQQRLHEELRSLDGRFDLMVADLGSGLTPWARRLWLQSQLVLLVSTTDGSALIDAYATVKRSVADALGPDTRLVMNQCDDERLADDAQQRFANACQRFLGRSVPALPSLPCEIVFDHASEALQPRVWEYPDTPFGHALLWLSRAVSDVVDASHTERAALARIAA